MAAWKRAGTCCLPSVPSSCSSSPVFSRPPRHLTHGQTHPHPGGPALALCNLFGSEASALCTFPCILPPSLSSAALCVCLCSSSSSCLVFLETNYRVLQEEKKQRGSSLGNVHPASFFLTFFSRHVLVFSLTSLYVCLCPSVLPFQICC